MSPDPAVTNTKTRSEWQPPFLQRQILRADTERVTRDPAPVVAAEVLLRHGLDDAAVTDWVARTWAIDEHECRAAVRAAHVLLDREHPRASADTD
jgi:hypothetical protein